MTLSALCLFWGPHIPRLCPGGRCFPVGVEGRSPGSMCRASSPHLGNIGSIAPGLQEACGSRVCGSTDFPKRTTQGEACGWPIARGWTPAARAYGTQHPSTSTSAPNTSRRTALSWWESGEPPCQPALGYLQGPMGRFLNHLARKQADLVSGIAVSSQLCTSVSSSSR